MTISFAAQKIHASLKMGDEAPEFSLRADGGVRVVLSKLKSKNVVLYFYPKDDTPECTIESKDFSDLMAEFANLNTAIVGVSCDTPQSHEEFKEKYCLPFTLASDEDGKVCKAYGVWGETNMYGDKYLGIERTTFLIDKQGKIARIWPRVKVDGHAKEVLDAVKVLK